MIFNDQTGHPFVVIAALETPPKTDVMWATHKEAKILAWVIKPVLYLGGPHVKRLIPIGRRVHCPGIRKGWVDGREIVPGDRVLQPGTRNQVDCQVNRRGTKCVAQVQLHRGAVDDCIGGQGREVEVDEGGSFICWRIDGAVGNVQVVFAAEIGVGLPALGRDIGVCIDRSGLLRPSGGDLGGMPSPRGLFSQRGTAGR